MNLDFATTLAGGPINGYQEDGSRKRRFQRRGMAFLREVGKHLPKSHGPVEVRWNRGGPEVSGDLILHTDRVYLWIDPTLAGAALGYYRSVKGRKDYTGGQNWPLRIELIWQGPKAVAKALHAVARKD